MKNLKFLEKKFWSDFLSENFMYILKKVHIFFISRFFRVGFGLVKNSQVRLGFQIPDPSLWCMYFSWFCVSEYERFIEKFLSNFTGWSGNPTKLASVNKPLAWQDQNYKILKCINSKRTPQIYSKSYISNGHTEEQ